MAALFSLTTVNKSDSTPKFSVCNSNEPNISFVRPFDPKIFAYVEESVGGIKVLWIVKNCLKTADWIKQARICAFRYPLQRNKAQVEIEFFGFIVQGLNK